MIPLTTVQDLFDYNYWARDRQLENPPNTMIQ